MTNLYKNGLPFSDGLAENIEDLKQRIRNKKASLLIIDGGVGEGKTTLAIHCAESFQKKPIDYRKQYAMGGDDFKEKLQICIDSGLRVVIYDEAGDFNKRGSLTAFNQEMNRVFETYRTFKILVILVLPFFGVLDDSLFHKQIPRLLLHSHDRTRNYGNYKGYSLFRMFYLKKYFKELTVPPHAYGRVKPNFRGNFKDLTPARSLELEKISSEGKKQFLNEAVIKNKGLRSPTEIGQKLGKSKQYINKLIKEMKLKPVTQYKRNRYFNETDFNKIKYKVRM